MRGISEIGSVYFITTEGWGILRSFPQPGHGKWRIQAYISLLKGAETFREEGRVGGDSKYFGSPMTYMQNLKVSIFNL